MVTLMSANTVAYIILGAIVFISLLMVFTSRSRIWRVYSKYLKVQNQAGITGEQFAFAAREMLGYDDMQLSLIDGKLSDAYMGGKDKVLFLSEEVAHSASLASVTIAAHEFGHAMQDHTNDKLYHLTRILQRITRFTNKLIIPCVLVGVGFMLFSYEMAIAYGLVFGGVGLFVLNALLKVLTIPMERDASGRALKFLKENQIISKDEIGKARKLLSIASQTYMVALFDDFLIVKLWRRLKYGKPRKRR